MQKDGNLAILPQPQKPQKARKIKALPGHQESASSIEKEQAIYFEKINKQLEAWLKTVIAADISNELKDELGKELAKMTQVKFKYPDYTISDIIYDTNQEIKNILQNQGLAAEELRKTLFKELNLFYKQI